MKHYNTVHGRNLRIKRKQFSSETEFDIWKKYIEREYSSWFVSSQGSKSYTNHTIKYYHCNRSGFFRKKEPKKRCRKSRGTSKINGKCCAFMTIRKDRMSGKVDVEYCLEHIGHTTKSIHVPLPAEIRTLIDVELYNGVNFTDILDHIRDNIVKQDSNTQQDGTYTRKEYNVHNVERDFADGCSIHLWVNQLRQSQDNDPVIIYKQQGVESPELGLAKDDFLLGVQTNFQKDMMQKYCFKMICADSSHATTQHDFSLTTILVLDDYGEAVPVAWAIANHEDIQILGAFLQALKLKGGSYKTEIFMGDLSNALYNAWVQIFTKPARQLYCSWRIDNGWRSSIQLIKDTRKQLEVYAFLKMLQYETDERKFRNYVQNILLVLENIAPKFKDYFHSTYVTEEMFNHWAACFHVATLFNLKTFSEVFYRDLQNTYFSRKEKERVDNLIVVLLKVARNIAIEQSIKCEKIKKDIRTREIKKQHELALLVSNITTEHEGEWNVLSATSDGVVYVVEKLSETCECKILCDTCSICVHTYSCTCVDYLMDTVPCKHIHAVHMHLEETMHSDAPTSDNDVKFSDDVNSTDYFSGIIFTAPPDINSFYVEKLRKGALKKVNDVATLIYDASNGDVLRGIITQINAAVTVGKGFQLKTEDPEYEKKFSPNEHFMAQTHFLANAQTSRSDHKTNKTLPYTEHTIEVRNVNEKVCSFCINSDDLPTDKTVEWLVCTKCHCSVHSICDVQIAEFDVGDYVCSLCK